MKNIFSIFKKEFDKIFKFPRMIFSTLVLPGLLIFVIYAFMGQGLQSQTTEKEVHQSIVYVINNPEIFSGVVSEHATKANIFVTESTLDQLDQLRSDLEDKKVDLIIEFDVDFDKKVRDKQDPIIKWHFSNDTNSVEAKQRVEQSLISVMYSQYLAELEIDPVIFKIDEDNQITIPGVGFNVLAMVLPIIIISFIFGSAMGIGSDAIAGEKERGTLATLLMAPINRNEIIIGKIFSTATITILAATSSFIGIAGSLPFAKGMFLIDSTIKYGVLHFLGIFGILILLSLFASSMLLIFSTIAKNVKEAVAYAMPIYIVALLVPAVSMFVTDLSGNILVNFIPIYNCVIALKGILGVNITLMNYLLVFGSSILYILLIIALLIRLFKNERVLFSK